MFLLIICPPVTSLLDPSTCTVSIANPEIFESAKRSISSCTLYHDKGPEPWLRRTSTDAWLSTGIGEAIDGSDASSHDQGDIYCIVCYESGVLEIFDVPNFSSVYSVDKFVSGKAHLVDTFIPDPTENAQKVKTTQDMTAPGKKEQIQNIGIVELAMHRWMGQHSRPFLFGILSDGTILCYHAYVFDSSDAASKVEEVVTSQKPNNIRSFSGSRLRNLRFVRVTLDTYVKEETSPGTQSQRITIFKNVGGCQGLFICGSRPSWFMLFRERLRIHPQVSLGSHSAAFLGANIPSGYFKMHND